MLSTGQRQSEFYFRKTSSALPSVPHWASVSSKYRQPTRLFRATAFLALGLVPSWPLSQPLPDWAETWPPAGTALAHPQPLWHSSPQQVAGGKDMEPCGERERRGGSRAHALPEISTPIVCYLHSARRFGLPTSPPQHT
jgi:hypothetical protein